MSPYNFIDEVTGHFDLPQNVSDDTVLEILKEVKQKGAEKRALLTIEEFREILARKVN